MSIHKKLKALIVITSILSLHQSHAFAGEEGKTEAKGEEKSGEKGEGADKKNVPEWMELQTQLSALDTRKTQKQEAIARLIEEKQKLTSNGPEVKTVIDEMVSEYKEWLKLQDEFNKKMIIFKFRYPERGAKEDRKYGHTEVKSLEQMEQELGIDGRLNRNTKKIRSQYRLDPAPPDALAEKTAVPSSPVNPAGETGGANSQKSIDDSSAIILKK